MIGFNKLLKLLLSNCLIFLQISVSLAESDGRIVGGNATTIDQAPYLVQIKSDGYIICGGALVTRNHVVSAAHCFVDNPENLVVVGGASKITDNGSARSNVSRILAHKNFDPVKYDMDIAVLKLETPLIGHNIKPISYDCQEEWKVGKTVRIFGWGQVNATTGSLPIDLQTAEVTVYNTKKCATIYRFKKKFTDSMVCAAAPNKDACSGDSGGPALLNNQFCAVVSWGIGCSQENVPGVYTDLKVVKDFIRRAIKYLK